MPNDASRRGLSDAALPSASACAERLLKIGSGAAVLAMLGGGSVGGHAGGIPATEVPSDLFLATTRRGLPAAIAEGAGFESEGAVGR